MDNVFKLVVNNPSKVTWQELCEQKDLSEITMSYNADMDLWTFSAFGRNEDVLYLGCGSTAQEAKDDAFNH